MLDNEEIFFSSVNYQKILNISEKEAKDLAITNQTLRQTMEHSLVNKVMHNEKSSYDLYFSNTTEIADLIGDISEHNGPCIIALFHLDYHIHLPLDLAFCGLPITLPVAGQPFQLLYKYKQQYAQQLKDNFELLQVENKATATQMIRGVKNNRHLCIYIDGNMGQDGVNVERSAEKVEFFGFSIRVKNSTQKLAQKYKLPILPIFADANEEGQPFLSVGEVIPTECDTVMQTLYSELQKRIQRHPEKWFYVQCLHRWVVHSKQNDELIDVQHREHLSFNHAIARLFHKNDNSFIVNYQTQRALLIDDALKADILLPSQQQIRPDLLQRLRKNNSPASHRFISSLTKENLLYLQPQIENQ